MLKDIIEYDGKTYQLSTIVLKKYCDILETKVFHIENGIVSDYEVFCFRALTINKALDCHYDILHHSKKYLNDKAIKEYLRKKEEED